MVGGAHGGGEATGIGRVEDGGEAVVQVHGRGRPGEVHVTGEDRLHDEQVLARRGVARLQLQTQLLNAGGETAVRFSGQYVLQRGA